MGSMAGLDPGDMGGFALGSHCDCGHMNTRKAFKSLNFSLLETGIKMSFAYLFPVSLISRVL